MKRGMQIGWGVLALLAGLAEGGVRNMGADVQIGNAIDGLSPTVAGTTNTYDFAADSLNMAGHKLYYNSAQRNVVLTNLTALTDGGGTAVIDTDNTGADYASSGYVKVYASSSFQIGGYIRTTVKNPLTIYSSSAGDVVVAAPSISIGGTIGGLSIDARGGSQPPGYGGAVTLQANAGVTLAGGIDTSCNNISQKIWITDGAGGSAGNVSIGGSLMARTSGASQNADGSILVRGDTVAIGGNLITEHVGAYWYARPITVIASGPLTIGGYLSSATTEGGQYGAPNSGTIILTGATVTVSGSVNGTSINSSSASDYGSNPSSNITVTATNGDLTIAGGLDASHPVANRRGTISLSATNGSITVGSLNANLFKTISLKAGYGRYNTIYVSGALANFTVSESPKKFTFPTGCVVSNNIYYLSASNTSISLIGTYAIFVASTDTGKLLKEGPPPTNAGTLFSIH